MGESSAQRKYAHKVAKLRGIGIRKMASSSEQKRGSVQSSVCLDARESESDGEKARGDVEADGGIGGE